MKKSEAISYIESCEWFTKDNDLTHIKELMHVLKDPQDKLKIIHVAGSNGKGSCVAMLTNVLINAGYKTGSFISPHLINYEERFLINNKQINEKDFISLTNKVKKASEKLTFKPTIFEVLTAMAYLYFYKEKCDVCVVEVGLGGRLDATNVIKQSELSIIMNIGLEHTQILGDTLDTIAKEKAGIIKENGKVLVYDVNNKVTSVYKKVCKEKNADLTVIDFSNIKSIKETLDYQLFNYGDYKNIKLSLLGKHQLNNAAMVIKASELLNNLGYKITKKNIYAGLANTKWDARLSILSKDPLFILDGAHNPQCAKALSESLQTLLKKKKVILLCGMLKDKDYQKSLSYLLPYAKKVITVEVPSSRSLTANELRDYILTKKIEAISANTISEGIKLSLKEKCGVVCFGSLYLAGEIKKAFIPTYKKYLREEIKTKRLKLNETKEYSKLICQKIKRTKYYKEAKNILIYNSINSEVDLSYLKNDKSKVFAYPLCVKDNIVPLIPSDDAAFKKGSYGILEPIETKSKLMKKIDLVIVPMVGYDESGNRLGNGKGYYDRLLNNGHYKTIGVGYNLQKVKTLPIENHDYKLDMIISEKELIKNRGLH